MNLLTSNHVLGMLLAVATATGLGYAPQSAAREFGRDQADLEPTQEPTQENIRRKGRAAGEARREAPQPVVETPARINRDEPHPTPRSDGSHGYQDASYGYDGYYVEQDV